MSKTVKVTYNADTLETTIVVDGKEFDTSRINGKGIADWAYPFMVRKVRWDGFYDEMVIALGGEKAFDLVFEGSEEALAELKEAWEDAPVNVVSGEQRNTIIIMYDADALTTEITVNGQAFDTTRINGKEIEDWVYPFMMRKIKWDGIFDELKKALDTDEYDIQFSGTRAAMKALMEDCPETVTISYQKSSKSVAATCVSKELSLSRKDSSVPEVTDDAEALYQKGKDFYDKEDYENAVSYFKQAAKMGNSNALCALGMCFFDGNGVEEDWDEAVEWYRKAAELGNAEAWYWIGFTYEIRSFDYSGDEIDKHYKYQKLAFEAYKESAMLGYAAGQNSLGECYINGVPEMDEKKAIAWFRKAAEQNNEYAQLNLGRCYRDGRGVSVDKSVAFYWFKKAAESDSEDAQRCVALCYFNGDGVPANSEEAVKWLKRSAENGNAVSCFDLGDCYLDGDGVEENEILAMKWYKEAIELAKDDEIRNQAEEALEKLNRNNITTQAFEYYENEDYEEAVSCFNDAANDGDTVAMFMLGLCYELGNGVRQNYNAAVNWYKKAADKGYSLALENLGDCYSEGNGVVQNEREAVRLYRKASEQGNVDAKAKLGVCYITGSGISENFDYGVQLIEEAAEEGSEYAQDFIEEYNEEYDEGYNDTVKERNSASFINKATTYLKSDQGKELLKKTGIGAAKGAIKGLASGGDLASVLGGAVTGAAGSAITAFSDDDE